MDKHAAYGELEKLIPRFVAKYKYRNDYDDILQEARIRVWETLSDSVINHPKANLPAYAQRVARNAANLWIQRRSKSPYIPYAERLKEAQLDDADFTYEERWRIGNYGNIHNLDSLDRKISLDNGDEDVSTRLMDLIPDRTPEKDTTLEDALGELEAVHQVILVLHDLDGMTMQEVSELDGKGRTPTALHIQRLKGLGVLEKLLIEAGSYF